MEIVHALLGSIEAVIRKRKRASRDGRMEWIAYEGEGSHGWRKRDGKRKREREKIRQHLGVWNRKRERGIVGRQMNGVELVV